MDELTPICQINDLPLGGSTTCRRESLEDNQYDYRSATCTHCVLNEKKVSKYTPSNFGMRTRGSSKSSILIFGWVLACAGSGVNKVTENFGADINS